jgi:SNF2 family DNA or RNA helicase
MEMQAISRAVRIGQTSVVTVHVAYVANTIDDKHKEKHVTKSRASVLVTGDSLIDSMYIELEEVLSKIGETHEIMLVNSSDEEYVGTKEIMLLNSSDEEDDE